ncbi:MAG: hypothetical protein PHP06_10150 [Clostridia bacterium]|nr:hypothetical protein [Clostridia bacterium]
MHKKDNAYVLKFLLLFLFFNFIVKKDGLNTLDNDKTRSNNGEIMNNGEKPKEKENGRPQGEDIQMLVLERGMDILKSVVPFFDDRDQKSIIMFLKLAGVAKDIRVILNPDLMIKEKNTINIHNFHGDEYDRVTEMMKKVKPFIRKEYHQQIDTAEKFNYLRKNYIDYIKSKERLHNSRTDDMLPIDVGVLEIMSPILTQEQNKKIQNFIRAAKLFEALNKIEDKSDDKQMVEVIKSMLNSKQQQQMEKFLAILNSMNAVNKNKQTLVEGNEQQKYDQVDENIVNQERSG